ncbi:MAG: amino acid ABC transporter permease, partial [Candidatus Rokuibacteriota bacterium]
MPPIAQYVFNGVVTGGILALPAVAFSLLWRLLRFPNFAVSTYLTVGAY